MGHDAMAKLIEHRPDLAEDLGQLPGYAVLAMSSTKIPGVGTGLGYGVVYQKQGDQRAYIKITQLEAGGGLGAQKFKLIILFRDESRLKRLAKGGLRYESGAVFSAREQNPGASVPVPARSGKGYRVFRLAENGAVATISIRLLHGQPYLAD
jgi:hypothetical protein